GVSPFPDEDTGWRINGELDSLRTAAIVSDDEFREALYYTFGIDADKVFEYVSQERGDVRNLAALTGDLGIDAFGSYLPWHAFANSSKTPWGIYISLTGLFEFSIWLHSEWPTP